MSPANGVQSISFASPAMKAVVFSRHALTSISVRIAMS
jgi:hypothetical protein